MNREQFQDYCRRFIQEQADIYLSKTGESFSQYFYFDTENRHAEKVEFSLHIGFKSELADEKYKELEHIWVACHSHLSDVFLKFFPNGRTARGHKSFWDKIVQGVELE